MTEERTPQRKTMLWVVIALLALGNLAAIVKVDRTQNTLEEMEQLMQAKLRHLDDQTHDLNVRADTHEVMLRGEVKDARKFAESAASQATRSAEKKATQVLDKLTAEYRQQNASLSNELGQVKSQTQQTSEHVSAVAQDVGNVRSDVDQTKTELDAARAQLKNVMGDLGVQSGLIATNADELATLRKLGERHYFEFAIPKDGEIHKVGNIGVELRKTKEKQGKFTLHLIADDIRVEKKERTVNEPIQFYASGSRQPLELVVNKVMKNKIAGYLSVPKVLSARR